MSAYSILGIVAGFAGIGLVLFVGAVIWLIADDAHDNLG